MLTVVYTLSFLGFDMDFGEGCDEMVQYLSIHNDLHPEIRYDIMHMVYVLLPRFGKEDWLDCEDAFEQLVFALKKGHTLPAKPLNFKDKALEGIFESAKICNLKPEELMDYEIEKKRFSDYVAVLDFAQEKARKETLAEVLSLWRKGYSPEEAEKMLSVKA
jgi:hypothetical protein